VDAVGRRMLRTVSGQLSGKTFEQLGIEENQPGCLTLPQRDLVDRWLSIHGVDVPWVREWLERVVFGLNDEFELRSALTGFTNVSQFVNQVTSGLRTSPTTYPMIDSCQSQGIGRWRERWQETISVDGDTSSSTRSMRSPPISSMPRCGDRDCPTLPRAMHRVGDPAVDLPQLVAHRYFIWPSAGDSSCVGACVDVRWVPASDGCRDRMSCLRCLTTIDAISTGRSACHARVSARVCGVVDRADAGADGPAGGVHAAGTTTSATATTAE
jgi:hypothetical protein